MLTLSFCVYHIVKSTEGMACERGSWSHPYLQCLPVLTSLCSLDMSLQTPCMKLLGHRCIVPWSTHRR